MEDLLLLLCAGLLVLLQLLTCIFCKRAWLRWMPFMVSVALTAFCMVMYLCSNQTNWGYIILIGLIGIVLLFQGIILLVNRLIRLMMKF